MAPTPVQTTGTLVPHDGTLRPSSASPLLDGGANPSKATIIVFTSLGIMGFITVLVLVLKRRSKTLPLPPVQPLAYYRERESEYLPQPYLPHKSMDFDEDGNERSSLGLFRMPSFRTIDSSHSRYSDYALPSNSFAPRTAVVDSPSPLSGESQSDEKASTSQEYISTARLARSSSLSRSGSRSRSRSQHDLTRKRSTSMASARTVSTSVSTLSQSVKSIRGPPHCPHNDIKIVLPAPLGPQLQSRTGRTPFAIQDYRQTPGHGRPISDRWMTALIRTTRYSSTDRKLFEGYSSAKRPSCFGSGHQNHSSLDTVGQLKRSELQPQSSGRKPFRGVLQPQFPGAGDPTTSPRSLDNQTRPLRTASQKNIYGQATNPFSEHRERRPSKLGSRLRARSFPRRQRSLRDALYPPLPQSVSSSRRNYISPRDERPPPPVPPLPQLPQLLPRQPENCHFAPQVRRSNTLPMIVVQQVREESTTPPQTSYEDLIYEISRPFVPPTAHKQ